MDETQVGSIHRVTDGGIAGSHPAMVANEVLVGPSTSDQRNRITTAIIPIACWRVEDLRFEFDSSFVRLELAEEIEHLVQLRENHKKEVKPDVGNNPALYLYPPLSIFGHADPVGDDNYNKQLSGRRAAAIYGMLTRDTHLWEEIYSHPYGGDNWARSSANTMLVALGYVSQGDGHASRQSIDGMKRFQKENGLAASGHADTATRSLLFHA